MSFAHRVELALLIWFGIAIVLGLVVGACIHFGMDGEPRDGGDHP